MAPNYNAFANNPYLNQQPQPQSNLLWVQGLEGAKRHLIAPGSSVALWDTQDQKIYIKSSDQSGVPQPMRILSYVEETVPEVNASDIDTSQFATKDDLAEIKTLLASLAEKSESKPSYNNNKKGANHNA